MLPLILMMTLLSTSALADTNTNNGAGNVITNQNGIGNSLNSNNGTHADDIDVSNHNTNINGQQQGQSQTSRNRNDNSNDGNTQAVAFNDKRQTASAYAPGLTSGLDTCTGSVSAGVSTGIVGFSAGGTTTDENCIRLKNSRELERKGFKKASLALLCMNAEVAEAMEQEDMHCPIRGVNTSYHAENSYDYPASSRH